ncbi:MAG TPA: inositol monophosphatase [Candidatus Merdisoma merdipullorum]|nr:inositol monophosphatase [Candidatus Merdisoma merdipullorum]
MKIEDVMELVKQTKTFVQNRDMAGHIKVKGLADFVTQVDTNIQNFLSEKLHELNPDIQFLGEEEGLHAMQGDTFWILDPIDGTTNLIHDYQHSTVSLGLYEKGEIVMGIIYDPFREEIFHAEKGKGSFRNGEPIHVAPDKGLSDTIVAIGTAPYQKELAPENFRRFERIFTKCQDIRRTGSAAMDLAYVACGRIGGFFEARLQPWDFAAGLLLVAEAGGKVTRFDGSPVNPVEPGEILATNGKLHEELKAFL